jgi:hypothetical protein
VRDEPNAAVFAYARRFQDQESSPYRSYTYAAEVWALPSHRPRAIFCRPVNPALCYASQHRAEPDRTPALLLFHRRVARWVTPRQSTRRP